MDILIINSKGENIVIETDFIPRVGDGIDVFYKPYPKVTNVLLFPSKDTLKAIGGKVNCRAIITVE